MSSKLKSDIKALLEAGDFSEIAVRYQSRKKVLSTLISLSYEKTTLTSWRAMDAVGRLTADEPEPRVRNTILRLLWMMREESGTNPWSAAEIIGEILAYTLEAHPKRFLDIVPIVISFAEEPIMRAGALRSMYRVGTKRPELVREFVPLATELIGDDDPQVRGYSVLALSVAGQRLGADAIGEIKNDTSEFLFYYNENLKAITVNQTIEMNLEAL